MNQSDSIEYAIGAPYPWQMHQWGLLCGQLQQQRLPHALLISGEPGIGKSDFARALSELVLCDQVTDGKRCGACHNCELLESGFHPDRHQIEPEEGSKVLKVDQIRELITLAEKTTHTAKFKVIILEQADRLIINAANALLKTLEEPPGQSLLMLVSDNPGMLLPTVRSRCRRLSFARPSEQQALEWLMMQKFDDAEEALWASLGRPLSARGLLLEGRLDSRRELLLQLSGLLDQSISAVDLAQEYRGQGCEEVLTQLSLTSSILLKYQLTRQESCLPDPYLQAMAATLQVGRRHSEADMADSNKGDEHDNILSLRLLEFHDEVEQSRKQLYRFSPNPQLLLESIFWRWARLRA